MNKFYYLAFFCVYLCVGCQECIPVEEIEQDVFEVQLLASWNSVPEILDVPAYLNVIVLSKENFGFEEFKLPASGGFLTSLSMENDLLVFNRSDNTNILFNQVDDLSSIEVVLQEEDQEGYIPEPHGIFLDRIYSTVFTGRDKRLYTSPQALTSVLYLDIIPHMVDAEIVIGCNGIFSGLTNSLSLVKGTMGENSYNVSFRTTEVENRFVKPLYHLGMNGNNILSLEFSFEGYSIGGEISITDRLVELQEQFIYCKINAYIDVENNQVEFDVHAEPWHAGLTGTITLE